MPTTPHGGCAHPDAKVDPDFECGLCPACRQNEESARAALKASVLSDFLRAALETNPYLSSSQRAELRKRLR